MPCYCPIVCFKPPDGGAISFVEKKDHREISIPCGKCIGCRIQLQEAWAFRCYAESKCHEYNSFITLTYDEYNLPENGSLTHRDWQLFAKRLRKKCGPFRFFMCGEYGENTGRAHYHALLFGFWPHDATQYSSLYAKRTLYRSKLLDEVWGKGVVTIGDVSWASARYCASYATKRLSEEKCREKYSRIDYATGEMYQLMQPYGKMSLKPGIGAEWIAKYWPEVCAHQGCYIRGQKIPIPRYFDDIIDQIAPDSYDELKHSQYKEAEKFIDQRTPERLEVRRKFKEAQVKFNREKSNHAL